MEILCAFIFLGLFLEAQEVSSMQNLNLSAILNTFLRVCDKLVGYELSCVIKTSVM